MYIVRKVKVTLLAWTLVRKDDLGIQRTVEYYTVQYYSTY
jgi:hypothetical protein